MTDITKACRDINELSSVAKKACNLFLKECNDAGINIFITETYRSQARQNYLYEQGRSRPGQKVTWTKSSNHTGRMAWDIAVTPPKDLYDIKTLEKAGAIAKKLGIEWGGTWSKDNLDRPHFQVDKNWKSPAITSSANTDNHHTVVKGDTLYYLAKKYGTTVANLQTLNPKVDAKSLQIGQKLSISGSKATYHKVVKGDTVSALAEKYSSTIKQIKDWNDLDSKYTITIGQKIRVK